MIYFHYLRPVIVNICVSQVLINSLYGNQASRVFVFHHPSNKLHADNRSISVFKSPCQTYCELFKMTQSKMAAPVAFQSNYGYHSLLKNSIPRQICLVSLLPASPIHHTLLWKYWITDQQSHFLKFSNGNIYNFKDFGDEGNSMFHAGTRWTSLTSLFA